jgi:hypothetical protein
MKRESDSSNATIVEFDDSDYDYSKPPPGPIVTPPALLKEREQFRQWLREAGQLPPEPPPASDAGPTPPTP